MASSMLNFANFGLKIEGQPPTGVPSPFGGKNRYILTSQKGTPRALPLVQSALHLFLAR